MFGMTKKSFSVKDKSFVFLFTPTKNGKDVAIKNTVRYSRELSEPIKFETSKIKRPKFEITSFENAGKD